MHSLFISSKEGTDKFTIVQTLSQPHYRTFKHRASSKTERFTRLPARDSAYVCHEYQCGTMLRYIQALVAGAENLSGHWL